MTPFRKVRLTFLIAFLLIFWADRYYDFHWLLYLVPVILFIGYVIYASSTLSLNAFIKSYTQPETDKKIVAITFDDGPEPGSLKVLEVLKKHQAKATFFCIGKKIEKHPEIFKRMVKEEHVVGNHSYSHNNLFPFFGRKIIAEEINRTNELIKKHGGVNNDLFRPPFGVANPGIAAAVETTNQKVIGWNLRSFDTSSKNQQKVIDRVKQRLKPGTVLLLHDNLPNTPEILEAILHYAKERGYTFVDVKTIFNLT